MSLTVALAVLFSALLHASWNAVIRLRGDRLATITLLAAFGTLMAVPGMFLVSPPRPESWPWLFASVVLHIGYNVFLANAYAHGELGKVYPLARGTAPLLTLFISLLVLREPLAALTVIGIVTLGLGILTLTLDQGIRVLRAAPQGAAFALGTSLFIAAYTIADGMGARAAGDPHAYTLYLFFFDGIPLVLYALWARGTRETGHMIAGNWKAGIVVGILSLGAYWIVIWAMTVAPIALVAALRETSVIIAVLIGVFFLGERLTAVRVLAIAVVIVGLVLLRL
jgi:drug/metabolite transporter (DMT)-like permease